MIPRQLSAIFRHSTTHNQAILKLLENTTIGTNGARYRHLHTAQKIASLHQPHYFTIYRNENAIANMTVCERPMVVGNDLTDTFYIRYFAFDKAFQTKEKTKSRNKSSLFQAYISNLLSTSNLNAEAPEFDPKIYWAIVDPKNNRSLQMGEKYLFETVSNIKTTAFSRFKLNKRKGIERATQKEQLEVWEKLQDFYASYNGLTNIHLFETNNYFVLRENGEIIAGIKADKVEWRIENLPGITGKLLVKILPYLPFLRRIINPKKYQFLATEGLFWKDGNEGHVQKLLEGVLYEQNCYSMLLWTDGKGTKLNRLLSSIKLGLLQKIKTDNEVNLVVRFNNVPSALQEAIRKQPHYILGFDCT